MQKYFKNSIILMLIVSFVVAPFFSVTSVANAQSNPNSGNNNVGGFIQKGVTGYIGELIPAIKELPLCKAVVSDSLKNLFPVPQVYNTGTTGGAIASLANNKDFKKLARENAKKMKRDKKKDLKTQEVEAKNALDSVQVSDPNNFAQIKLLQEKVDSIKADIASLNANDTCLKSIGRMVIGILIRKLQQSTVAWIQGGFEGNPAFIQDPGAFFTDVAKTEILQFGLEINDPVLFPFGRNFMINQALSFNSTFQENAQYSLNKLIQNATPQYTAENFNGDFSQGGWNAWTNMVSIDANNPLGFQLLAQKELDSRIANTTGEIKDELQQGNGYLGDKRCIQPKGLTNEEHKAALAIGKKVYVTPEADSAVPGTEDPGGVSAGYDANASYGPNGYYHDSKGAYYIEGACRQWEYLTPGQMIATAATNVVNYPNNNLLKAEDLNDAVGAILDGLLAKFSTNLMQQGFAKLGNEGLDGSLIINQDQVGYNYTDTQVEHDFYTNNMNSDWFAKNPDFNIRYDLTQAFIDTQRTYAVKLSEYSDALKVLNRNIYQLDYCIPGPAPDWKDKAYANLSQNVSKSIPENPGGIVAIIKGLFTMLKGITVGVSFIVKVDFNIGQISEGIMSMLGEGLPEEIVTRYYYTTVLINHTGMRVAPSVQIGSKGDVENIIGETIDAYDKATKKTFNANVMPQVTASAKAEYEKVDGYKQIIEENTSRIATMRSMVTQLVELKKELGALTSTQLEELGPDSPITSKFARLSENFVDGDNIDEVISLINQAKDEKDYVYKDLLTGATGCECAEASNTQLENDTDRMEYPPSIFVPLPGHEYTNGVTCSLPTTTQVTTCPPPQVMNNTGQCVLPYVEACVPPLGFNAGNPDTPGYVPPLPQPGCVTPGPTQNPYDQNQDAIDIECDYPLFSVNGVCTAPDPGLTNIFYGITPPPVDDGTGTGDESEFTNTINSTIDNYMGEKKCKDTDTDTLAKDLSGKLIQGEKDFAKNNKGFLKKGYYGQLESYNPYQFITRTFPADAVESEKVKLPYGIINLSQQCPVLTFGPTASKGAKRALNSEIKQCFKENKPGSDGWEQCIKDAVSDAQKLLDRSCIADVQIKAICADLRLTSHPVFDSVRRFEKIMGLY